MEKRIPNLDDFINESKLYEAISMSLVELIEDAAYNTQTKYNNAGSPVSKFYKGKSLLIPSKSSGASDEFMLNVIETGTINVSSLPKAFKIYPVIFNGDGNNSGISYVGETLECTKMRNTITIGEQSFTTAELDTALQIWAMKPLYTKRAKGGGMTYTKEFDLILIIE